MRLDEFNVVTRDTQKGYGDYLGKPWSTEKEIGGKTSIDMLTEIAEQILSTY